ncbi:uncharacterized protein V6R79_011068, partial [Siganus canaliculatus]
MKFHLKLESDQLRHYGMLAGDPSVDQHRHIPEIPVSAFNAVADLELWHTSIFLHEEVVDSAGTTFKS